MAPYRKRLLDGWETEKQKYEKRVSRAEAEVQGAKDVILEYLKKPAEWLALGVKRFYGYSTYSAKGMGEYLDGLDVFKYGREEETRTYIASINPSYYNRSLIAEIPQSILLVLRKGSYSHMKKLANLVHQPGALTALENILIGGK